MVVLFYCTQGSVISCQKRLPRNEHHRHVSPPFSWSPSYSCKVDCGKPEDKVDWDRYCFDRQRPKYNVSFASVPNQRGCSNLWECELARGREYAHWECDGVCVTHEDQGWLGCTFADHRNHQVTRKHLALFSYEERSLIMEKCVVLRCSRLSILT